MSVVTTLRIQALHLKLRLGWDAAERQLPQLVQVTLAFRFAEPPNACQSDELAETICYDRLTQQLRAMIAEREFRLLEHFSAWLYQVLTPLLPQGVLIRIVATKPYPPVTEIKQGVTFEYGDW